MAAALLAVTTAAAVAVAPATAAAADDGSGTMDGTSSSGGADTGTAEELPPGFRRLSDDVLVATRSYGPDRKQAVDVHVPDDAPLTPRPTLVLVHGGAWQIGDRSMWRDGAVRVVRERGWTVVTVSYRLAPAVRWPAPYDDVVAAVRHVRENAAELGVDPARVAAMGDSAGGQLAALLGRATPQHEPVSAVVTWSGISDLPGLLRQRSSGGCPTSGCSVSGLALKVQRDLMGCAPARCPSAYRHASPAAGVTRRSAPVLAFNSEAELVDPRQAWAMDSALARVGRSSRVVVYPGRAHARGYASSAWGPSMRWLAAHLQPETAPPYPKPRMTATLDLPTRKAVRAGKPVRLRGVVRPRVLGSSVAVQYRGGDGVWRTHHLAPLRAGRYDTYYDTTWTPRKRGTTTWRVVWRGSGTTAVSRAATLVAS